MGKRNFICSFHFVDWSCISIGFHIDFYCPNIEIHLPFGFIRIGWERYRLSRFVKVNKWFSYCKKGDSGQNDAPGSLQTNDSGPGGSRHHLLTRIFERFILKT